MWRLQSDNCTPACTCTLLDHAVIVWQVAFSPNGMQLASSAGDGSVHLWRLCGDGTATTSKVLAGHTGIARAALAYHPRGRQLVCGSSDGSLNVYQ